MAAKSSANDDSGDDRRRQSDASRKRKQRADDRDLKIGKIAEPNRRADCLADVYLALKTYWPDVFFQEFTPARREMIDAIRHASIYGGDQAVAGPRGDGKTRSALFTTFCLALAGFVPFTLVVSKSGGVASRELSNLKFAIQQSKPFKDDFPEIAQPILELGRWASRARQQTAFGHHTDLEWSEERIVLPRIKSETLWEFAGWPTEWKSAAEEQIVASLGIEGPIRGYNVRNRRPTQVLLDDIDDRESAESETQTATREGIIEADIAGLGGPDRTVSRVMLCTLINQTCIAATFTDRGKKASFRGIRHKLLVTYPTHMWLWDEYIQLRQNRAADDPDARIAHVFYLTNREEMDAGTVVSNPYRFDARILSDGSQSEVSAVQSCFNIIADRGQVHFDTEYQNDPPKEQAPVESGISSQRVQRQLSGLARGVVAEGFKLITQGVDVKKMGLHWVIRAWKLNEIGELISVHTIDYGFHETHGVSYGDKSEEGLDIAVRRAISERYEITKALPYTVDMTAVDARWRTDAVYAACAEARQGLYPIMGFGRSRGCAGPNFSPVQRRSEGVRPGDRWKMVRKGNVWLIECDADHWKNFEHDRWMTDPTKPGAMLLFGEGSGTRQLSFDERGHHAYSRHIVAEVEVEEWVKGILIRKRKPKPGHAQDHYLDASYYSDVVASVKGMRLPGVKIAKPTRHIPQHRVQQQEQQLQPAATTSSGRMSLSEMRRRAS